MKRNRILAALLALTLGPLSNVLFLLSASITILHPLTCPPCSTTIKNR